MAVSVDRDRELANAVLHVVGQNRAYLDQVRFSLAELRGQRDERADRVIEALELTLRAPAGPGTLRHVEFAASALLLSLREGQAR